MWFLIFPSLFLYSHQQNIQGESGSLTKNGPLFLSYNWKEKLLISKLEIRNHSLCVSCAFHSSGQEMWARGSSSWEYSLCTFLHESTCTYHAGPTLTSAEPSAWFLTMVIGFNIRTPRSYQNQNLIWDRAGGIMPEWGRVRNTV